MRLNDLRSINNLFGLASKVHPIPMSEMENRVRKTSLEVETDTTISTVTFFPTYHHLGKWSYCFLSFFCLCSRWHWVMRQPGLKAARHSRPCMAQRELQYSSVWTNCVRMTLDLESGGMRREQRAVLSVRIVSHTQPHRHLDPFSALSLVSHFASEYKTVHTQCLNKSLGSFLDPLVILETSN